MFIQDHLFLSESWRFLIYMKSRTIEHILGIMWKSEKGAVFEYKYKLVHVLFLVVFETHFMLYNATCASGFFYESLCIGSFDMHLKSELC